MKHKRAPAWFPVYIDKWLLGSTRHELTHEERAIWTDLMALSKKDAGYVRANEGTPYPPEQLAGMFMSRFDTFEKTLELVQRTIAKCLDPTISKLKRMPDGTLFVISHESYLLSDRWERELNKRKPLPKKGKPLPKKGKSYISISISNSIKEIIKYLNEKTGKKFRSDSKATLDLIRARLNEKYTVDDFKKVIDTKVAKWKNQSWTDKRTGEVCQGNDFLRPSTLFRPTNFEAYLNEQPPAAAGDWHREAEERIKKKQDEGEIL